MKRQKKTTRRAGRLHPFCVALAVLTAVIGLSLLLYPTVSDYVNSLGYREAITDYRRQTGALSDVDYQRLLDEARAYNADLLRHTTRIGALTDEQRERYNSLLDLTGTGMMGYVEVEKADAYLPIYHGTAEGVLQSGVGHMEGSSLPVGGQGVHTLLSGHSGLPSAKLFSNLDRVQVGDTFALHVLNEVFTYQVESVVTVLPEEIGDLRIDPDQDVCTLMTCTPYGINTHRLLVRGVRIETPEPEHPDTPSTPTKAEEELSALPPTLRVALAILLAIAVFAAALIWHKRRRRKRRLS